VYFAIIISVAREIISFLLLLFIIIISFAHAFYILLLPRSDNDPNNPWKLAPTYNQIFENGTIDSNPFLIQPPNENTNMFIDFKTSLFAMYKFLTGISNLKFVDLFIIIYKYFFKRFNLLGDSSALSNWTYLNNPPLVFLIVLFSFLIVVYLMNLFIGLLNNAINKDYNRVSYLVQKAEV
jgi:hypothetical protein